MRTEDLNRQAHRRMITCLVVILFMMALLIAGRWDHAEAERHAKHYREMVCAGHWPAYDGEVDCE